MKRTGAIARIFVMGLFILSFFLGGTKEVEAVTPAEYGLKEGDVISSFSYDGDPDVFIINDYGYKRLFLNPVIFGFYGHLGFGKVISVPAATKDAFITSGYFRNCEANDPKVYAVEVSGEDEGVFHHLNVSGEAATAEDADFFQKVFCINNSEDRWYLRAAVYTALSQAPKYHRSSSNTPTDTTPAPDDTTAPDTASPDATDDNPDLVVSIQSIDKTTITYAQTPWTWITYKVTNQGTAAATAPFYLRILNNGVAVSGYMTVTESLAAGASVTKTFAVGHDSVWPVGSYKVKLEVDYTKVVAESNESNNISNEQIFTVASQDSPDLTVTIDSIDKTSIVYGQTPWTWITYHITNAGTKSVTGPIYLRAVNNDIPVSGYMTVDGTLAPGASSASKTFAVGHDSVWPVGSYNVKLEVDYANSVSESNETNNYSNTQAFAVVNENPDLSVSIESIDKTSIIYAQTPWTWVTYKVTNNGTKTAAAPFYLRIIKNGTASSGYMTVTESLSPGASVTKTFAVGHDSGWPVGSYAIKLEADYTGVVTETDETNNYSNEQAFTVVQDNPDLTVTIDGIDKTSMVYAQIPWTWVSYHVTNNGTKSVTGPFYLRILNNGVIKSGYMTVDGTLAPGASSAIKTFAVGHDSAWPMGSYNIKLEVDYPGTFAESNETNNYSNELAFTVTQVNPDLSVSIESIDKTTITYAQTPWTWVTYKVTNNGTVTANAPFYLRIIESGTPRSGYMTVTESLVAGASVTKTFAVGHDSGWPAGSYNIKLEVDYTGVVAETNETNNYSNEQVFTVVPDSPDLTVTIDSIDKTSIVYGQTPWTWITYHITNAGTKSVTGPIYLRAVNNDIPVSGYMTVDGTLAPGASSASKTFAVGHDSVWPVGSYNVKLEVDYANSVSESNETNNYSNTQAFAVVNENPDLTVSIESIERTNIVYAQTPWTWVTYKVTNNGTNTTTTPFYLRIIKNGTPSSGYMTITESLAAGASVTKTFAVGHDSGWPVGSYTIKLEADYTGLVTETNETNNYSNEQAFTVVSPNPDLVVTITSIDRTTITYGQSPWTWVNYKVTNNGTVTANAPFKLRVINNGAPKSGYMTVSSSLIPGASTYSSFAVGHDSGWPVGSYNIKLEADYTGVVTETDETNNYSNEQAFTVISL